MPRWALPGEPIPEPPQPKYPGRETYDDDVDPICGHRRLSRCQGCGACAACDGCYCDED